jgi:hypothetical protein
MIVAVGFDVCGFEGALLSVGHAGHPFAGKRVAVPGQKLCRLADVHGVDRGAISASPTDRRLPRSAR